MAYGTPGSAKFLVLKHNAQQKNLSSILLVSNTKEIKVHFSPYLILRKSSISFSIQFSMITELILK